MCCFLKSNSKALSCVKSSFLSLSRPLFFVLSFCLICSSGHYIHQPFQLACLSKPEKCSLKNCCRLFSWLLSYAKRPSEGETHSVTTSQPSLMGYNSPDDLPLLPFPLPFHNLCACSVFASFPVLLLNTVAHILLPAELPYGWEEIDDPQYGTYYVE